MTDGELAAALGATWESIRNLLSQLSEEDWERPTDCPGWTVKDQVSHLSTFELQWFLRGETPAFDRTSSPELYAHVQNELGEQNEAWIAERRSWPPADVVAEFERVTEKRLIQINAARYYPKGFDTIITTFKGDEPMRDALELRLFDIWVHEQDIRRAVSKPGNTEGPAMLHARERMINSLPWAAVKQANLPEGSTVGVSLYGSEQFLKAIHVQDGKGSFVQAADSRPTAAITMHEQTFLRVTTGRADPKPLIEDGTISLRGDLALAEQMALGLKVLRL